MNAKNRKPAQPIQSGQSGPFAAPITPRGKPRGKPRKPHAPDAAPAATPDHLVRLHDLSGLVVISLPEALRDIIGEEAFKRRLDELNRHEFRLIVRESGDVVYINMPIYVMSGRAHGLGPLSSANPLDTDGKSKGKGSARSREKSRKKSQEKSQDKSKTRNKPAVKPSTQAKAKAKPGRGAGANQ